MARGRELPLTFSETVLASEVMEDVQTGELAIGSHAISRRYNKSRASFLKLKLNGFIGLSEQRDLSSVIYRLPLTRGERHFFHSAVDAAIAHYSETVAIDPPLIDEHSPEGQQESINVLRGLSLALDSRK